MAKPLIHMELTGVKEIDQVLREMPSQLTRKVLQSAARKAAKPMVADMKAKAPERTGALVKSIGVKALKSRVDNLRAVVVAGVRRGRRYKAYHAHLIEFGTSARTPKKKKMLAFWNGEHIVRIGRTAGTPAQPFIRPAIDAHIDGVKRNYGENVGKALNTYMKRIIKKHG